MKNLKLLSHPVILHKLGKLRNKDTHPIEFRSLVAEISRYLAYEATRDWETERVNIQTPLAGAEIDHIIDPPIAVSIMRAGNGMLDAVLSELPFAQAGHIGIYRDKFIKNTVEYYFKLPSEVKGKPVLLLDPLIATGDTSIACVDRLKQYEVGKIRFLSILVSKKGASDLFAVHPDVEVFTVGVEEEVNEQGYLVPGIGDAGDRLYNTI